METKLFEVRDRMTFIPVICIKLSAVNEAERYLAAMSGYGVIPAAQGQIVLLARLYELKFEDSPAGHPGAGVVRTMPAAHRFIRAHWDELASGDVIDVEFILGETTEPKRSQRLENA